MFEICINRLSSHIKNKTRGQLILREREREREREKERKREKERESSVIF